MTVRGFLKMLLDNCVSLDSTIVVNTEADVLLAADHADFEFVMYDIDTVISVDENITPIIIKEMPEASQG